jgi:peptide deformylase
VEKIGRKNTMELKLIPEGSPSLKQPSIEFDFDDAETKSHAKEFAESLYKVMKRNDGLGISACQVGHNVRAFAMRDDKTEPFVLFNPIVVNKSENLISMKEGCLSFPLLFLNVKRPDALRIRYQDYNGETHTKQFIGMSARIALHELDHLDGVCYTEAASKFETERALRKRMILKRKVK